MTGVGPSDGQGESKEFILPTLAARSQTTDFTSGSGTGPPPPLRPGDTVVSAGLDSPGAVLSGSVHPESRYAVDRLHAAGGIGQVWLARDTQLNRDVALKTLRPELLDHSRVRNRFLQEAQITGQLEHPGIVPVYEFIAEPHSGPPFYTMRFVHGRTLVEASRNYHEKRHADPLGLVSLLSAFVAVCNTVAYAHARGVVHRDLKGENVLLGSFGEVAVLDWGVAKVLGAPEEDGSTSPRRLWFAGEVGQTIEGDVVGTPAYMAPEQAEGRPDLVDSRTDIYGLGAILYEILTGQPPFTGSNTMEVLGKVVREEPIPPHELWPDVPQALEAICLRALSKDPAGRHASAATLGQEIQTWQEVQRRQAEEELRSSRERFELAVRGSQDGLWDWDLRTDEVFFSPRWKEIIGFEDHEIAHHLDEWAQRLHPDDRERVLAANYAHINGTTSHYQYEYRLRHKDGSYRWILARGVALRDASGKAYRMAGSHVDITARKQMEETLREVEQRYRTVIDFVPCAVLVVDAEGHIRDCNAQAAQMLGVSDEQRIHGSLIELCQRAIGEDGLPLGANDIRALIQAITRQQYHRLSMGFQRDDGILNRVSLASHPIGRQDSPDRLGAVIFLQRDSN